MWNAYPHQRPHWPQLTRQARADVVIVGAGIGGALMADAVSNLGLRPLLLDRRGPCLGSTAASTALLQYELDTPLIELVTRVGRPKAHALYRHSFRAVQALAATCARRDVGVPVRPRPSLYLAGSRLNAAELRAECRERQRAGLPTELLSRRTLGRRFGIDRPAALLGWHSFEVDPVAMTTAFLRHVVAAGATAAAPHEVVDVDEGRRWTLVTTADGIEVACRHVVFCTGYEMPYMLPRGRNRLTSTWAVATPPGIVDASLPLIWEASDPYLYVRSTTDGRVVWGGGDEPCSNAMERDRLLPSKSRQLQDALRRVLPQLDPEPEYAWSGSFATHPEGRPTFGAIPGKRRCFFVLGYGGNGITFAMLAARFICAELMHRPSPASRLFALD